jgi:hypothetical protein
MEGFLSQSDRLRPNLARQPPTKHAFEDHRFDRASPGLLDAFQ